MPYAKRASLALILSMMPLNACAKAHSDALCLTVPHYSAAEQAVVADEIAQLGAQSRTGVFIADYGRLRDEARVLCR